jgi:hypothetical protein
VHEAGGDWITAGDLFDLGFRPRSSFLGFGCNHEARAGEHREIGRMAVKLRCDEGFHGSDGGIVAEDGGDGVEPFGFSVASWTIEEGERVFAGIAGEAVAAPTLQVADQLGVAAGALVEEGAPARAGGGRGGADCGDLIDTVGWIGGPQLTGVQVDRSARCCNQEGVAIPVRIGDGEGAVRPARTSRHRR